LKTEVNSFNEEMVKMVLNNDNEAMLKLYVDDAISLPSYQPMIKGMEALKKSTENQPEMNMKTFNINSTDVWVSGNFVVDIGTYDLTMDMPEMGEIMDKGKYLNLFEIQKDGSLKIKADTWNTDMNPWEEMMKHEGDMAGEKK